MAFKPVPALLIAPCSPLKVYKDESHYAKKRRCCIKWITSGCL